MKPRSRNAILAVLLMTLALLALPLRSGQASPEPRQTLEQAWAMAQTSGTFAFRSTATQTVTPAPALRNAARQVETTEVAVEGSVDRPAASMQLTLWTDGSFNPDTGLQMRVDGTEAFGRVGQGEWEPIENHTDFFAPGGDPLNFLAGMRQVEYAGQDVRQLGDVMLTFDLYTFDFDGPAYAEHMRGVIEQRLHDTGELPRSLSLETPEVYRDTTGSGTIWLTPDGLPYRLAVELELPDEADGDTVSATITTDLFDYDMARIGRGMAGLWHNPQAWLTYRLADLQVVQNALPDAAVILSFYLVLIVAVHTHRRRYFYPTLVTVMIVSMVFGPLFEGYEVRAYQRTQATAAAPPPVPPDLAVEVPSADAASAEARREAAQAAQPTWNPQTNPLSNPPALAVSLPARDSAAATLTDDVIDPVDSDGDGLLDIDEEFYKTCAMAGGDNCDGVADPKDSDGDGLSDGAEVTQLYTEPLLPDTDGDLITDTLEIAGFTFNSIQWYLDPNEEDTNRDGLLDSGECSVVAGALDCPDTDGDGTPDVFDDDNDGDGLIDVDDASPFIVPETYDAANPLALTIDNFTPNLPLAVELQIRPTNIRNLGYNGAILDWPSNDDEGQIQRQNDTTFATTTSEFQETADYRSYYGDVRVTPMLEITLPYTDGHYANLPVAAAYQGTQRDLGTPLTDWLDKADLAPYSVNVQAADPDSGDLVAFVPLQTVKSAVGGTPVAFSAKMLYEPSQIDWGAAHEFRVVWIVQMLTDECTVTDNSDNCLVYADKLEIIHIYEEEWNLVGMTVSEQHGLDVGIIYEQPGANYDEAAIWAASWNLSNTWLEGRDCDTVVGTQCQGDGNRDVTLTNMETALNDWNSGTDNTVVALRSYPHQDFSAQIMMTDTIGILNTVYGAHTDLSPTFLVAQEIKTRDADLGDGVVAGQALTFDMTPFDTELVASLSWAPYQYANGTWQNYPIEAFLARLETQLKEEPYYQPVDDSEEALGEAEGKLIFAQIYYSIFYKGAINLIEVDDIVIWNIEEAELPAFLTIDSSLAVAEVSGIGWVNWSYFEILNETIKRVRDASKIVGNAEAMRYTWYAFKDAFNSFEGEYFKSALKTAKSNKVSSRMLQGFTAFRLATALTVVGIGLYIAGIASGNEDIIRAATVVLAASQILWQSKFTLTMLQNVAAGLKAGKTFSSAIKITSKFRNVGVVALLVGVTATWAMFAIAVSEGGADGQSLTRHSIAFNMLLAYAIAATIVSIIIFIIDLIPLVGQIITAILAIIDAILLLAGKTTLTDRFTQWLADLLYEVDYAIVNLSENERLELDPAVALVDEEMGLMVGNSMTVTVGVTNTLIINNGDARNAVFQYGAASAPIDVSDDLTAGARYDDYADVIAYRSIPVPATGETLELPAAGLRLVDSATNMVTLTEPGINWTPSFFVTESFRMDFTGCWQVTEHDVKRWSGLLGLIIDAFDGPDPERCQDDTFKDYVPIDIGSGLIFDVLPSDIDEFMSGFWANSDEWFLPEMADRDNDGLADDGTDPNDGFYDNDLDGLSDYFEVATRSDLGLSASSRDTDNDGLTDREELEWSTDPARADSDGDGLSDYFEVKVGWPIVYTALDGTDLLAHTWSNPLAIDIDDDGLSDFDEFVYGFNPYVATDPSIIGNLIQFDNLRIDEVGTPVAALKFEEPDGVDAFVDTSSSTNHGLCDRGSGTCPTLVADGRFGGAAEFDGTQLITLADTEDINLRTAESAAISAWFSVDDATINTRPQIVYEEGGVTNGFSLFVYDGMLYGNAWADIFYGTVQTPVTTGQWTHAVLVLDSSDAATGLKLYVNGSEVDAAASAVVPLHIDDIGIGGVAQASRYPAGVPSDGFNGFAGRIDEVILYNTAVTTETIQALAFGHYNVNDLIVRPGTELAYSVQVTNTTSLDAQGILQARSSYVDPALETPDGFFRFEETEYQIIYTNDTGESSNVICLNDGTCPASTAGGPTGLGAALQFDGSSDSLILPALTYSQSQVTLAFWLYVDTLPAAGQRDYILSTTSEENGALDIYLDSDGRLWFDVAGMPDVWMNTDCTYDFGGGGEQCNVTEAPWSQPHKSTFTFSGAELGTWHHILFSYRNGAQLYIDADLDSNSFLYSGGSQAPGLRIGTGYIGQKGDGTGYLDGRLDELVLYNDANFRLSESNINRIQLVYDGTYDIVPAAAGVGESHPSFLQTYVNNSALKSVEVINAVDGDFLRCATLNSCPTQGTAGIDGEAVDFDGSGDHFTVQTRIDPAATPFSAATWFYPHLSGSTQSLITQDDVVDEVWLGIYSDGTLYSSLGTSLLKSSNPVQFNAWNHGMVTYDGTTLRLYLNGVMVEDARAVSASDGDLQIGRLGGTYYDGLMDNLMIFPSVVSADALPFIKDMVYPALAIDDDFINFEVSPLTTVGIAGSADVDATVDTSLYRVDQVVEAALVSPTPIPFTYTNPFLMPLGSYLPFEESFGATLFQEATDALDWATCEGITCPLAGVPGVAGRGVYFDGVNDFLDGTNGLRFQTNYNMTLAVWVKADRGTIVDLPPLELDFNNVSFTIECQNFNYPTRYDLPINLPENVWTHVVVQLSKSTGKGRVFINGQLDSEISTCYSQSGSSTDTDDGFIGSNRFSGDPLHGFVDDLRLYASVSNDFTEAEIAALYRDTAPVLQFSFDEESDATTYVDSSHNGYTGIPFYDECVEFTLQTADIAQQGAVEFLVVYLDGELVLYERIDDLIADGTLNFSAPLCEFELLDIDTIDATTGTVRNQANVGVPPDVPGEFSRFISNGGFVMTLNWAVGSDVTQLPNPAPGTDGQIGNTAVFDGNGFIEIVGDIDANELVSDFTLMAWVKPEDSGSRFIFSSGRQSNDAGFGLQVNAQNRLQLNRYAGLSNAVSGSSLIEADRWTHVALVIESDNDARFYANGVLQDAVALVDPILPNNADPFYVGTAFNGSGDPFGIFNGEIDELVVYRRALLDGEIASTYQRERRWYRDLNTSYVQVDSDLPVFEFLTTRAYRSVRRTQLAVTVTDPTSYVSVVDFGVKAPGEMAFAWSTPPRCADTAGTWCPSFTPTEEGEYTFQFRGVDAVGNLAYSNEYVIYFDGTPPGQINLNGIADYADTWLPVVAGAEVNERYVSLTGTLADPDIAGTAVAGSGVFSPSVVISLHDMTGELVGTGLPQDADVAGDTWTVDYIFRDLAPTGRYTVSVSAVDSAFPVPNGATWSQGTILLDARPTLVDLDVWSVPYAISGTATITGTVSEQPSWVADKAVARYHFESPSGLTAAYDSGVNGDHGTCATAGTCPTAVPGHLGNALQFDPADAWSTLDLALFYADRQASVSFWLNPDTLTAGDILTIAGGDDTLRLAVTLTGTLELRLSNVGGFDIVETDRLTPGSYQHVAATFDGNQLKLYHNGSLAGAVTVADETLLSPGVHNLQVGGGFDGAIDELTLYDEALTSELVALLANTVGRGLSSVEVRFEPIDLAAATASNAIDAAWLPAAVLNPAESLSPWTITPPVGVEDFYRLQVRSTDGGGIVSPEDTLWRGIIDTYAPRISLVVDNRGTAVTERTRILFSIEDKFLDPATIIQPCGSNDATFSADSETGQVYRMDATCFFEGHGATDGFVAACDTYGNCASAYQPVPTNNGFPAPENVLFEPFDHQIFDASAVGQSIFIRGGATGGDGVEYTSIEVDVNGVFLESIIPDGGWEGSVYTSTLWVPTATGLYTITTEAISFFLVGDRFGVSQVWIKPDPMTLSGTVTLNGAAAPDGTELYALVNGQVVTRTSTSGGTYQVDIPPQNPFYPDLVTGGIPGDTVSFRLAGFEVGETTTWQAGANATLNVTDGAFAFGATRVVSGLVDVVFPALDGQAALVIDAWGYDMAGTSITVTANTGCPGGSADAVGRCFDIAPSGTGPLFSTLTFYFYEDQLDGKTCQEINVYHDNGDGTWSLLPIDPSFGVGGRLCQPAPYLNPHAVRVVGVSDYSQFELRGPAVEACVDVAVAAGWNMLSLPVQPADASVATLFPNAVSPAYEYQTGYAAVTSLTPGKAFWLKFAAAETATICGTRLTDAVPVSAGWNMIGVYDEAVDVAQIGISAGTIDSPFYGYATGYTAVTTLQPGQGYWVKVSADGTLTWTTLSAVPGHSHALTAALKPTLLSIPPERPEW